MASVEQANKLMTVEEFRQRSPSNSPDELVQGKVVEMNVPRFKHGNAITRVSRILDEFQEKLELGHVTAGDSGVITGRSPDTLRGADVAYFSYERIPKDDEPIDYPEVSPEVVFEIRSPSERWAKVIEKVAEYLNAGVLRVCVIDPPTRTIHVYLPDQPAFQLTEDKELTLPEMHADFREKVSRFFP